jgi:hypothetical protein
MMLAGALGEIRTPDPQIRSLMLYPAELRAHIYGLVVAPMAEKDPRNGPRARHRCPVSPYSAFLRFGASGLGIKMVAAQAGVGPLHSSVAGAACAPARETAGMSPAARLPSPPNPDPRLAPRKPLRRCDGRRRPPVARSNQDSGPARVVERRPPPDHGNTISNSANVQSPLWNGNGAMVELYGVQAAGNLYTSRIRSNTDAKFFAQAYQRY